MSETAERMELEDQIAYRLFGFVLHTVEGCTVWRDAQSAVHHRIPAYTTDPAATAQVWQWVEGQRGRDDMTVAFEYWAGHVSCRIATHNGVSTLALDDGTTWPEALCRAALALAEALEQREGEGR